MEPQILIVLDDMIESIKKSSRYDALITAGRHDNLCTLVTLHNLSNRSEYWKTTLNNANQTVLFNMPFLPNAASLLIFKIQSKGAYQDNKKKKK